MTYLHADGPIADPSIIQDILHLKMPWGKYKGRIYKDIPPYYLEWLSTQGFPKNRVGMILSTLFVIKTHGLDFILETKLFSNPHPNH